MIPGITASQQVSGGVGAPIDLTEPWGEAARQTTISGGRLVLSGLNLSGLIGLRLHINGIKVATDDSIVRVRLIINSTEISSGYNWANSLISSSGSLSLTPGTTSDSGVGLTHTAATHGLGNAATASLQALLTLWMPNGSQPKAFTFTGGYLNPSGHVKSVSAGIGYAVGQTGPVTGFVVYASSNLTAGSLILQGIE